MPSSPASLGEALDEGHLRGRGASALDFRETEVAP